MKTFDNFMFNTEATFKACKTPKRKYDFRSKGRSWYWYGTDQKGDYVIRKSDHWVMVRNRFGRVTNDIKQIASCRWHLKVKKDFTHNRGFFLTGKAYLKNFKTNV